jgi:hypothetical protein
MMTVVVEEVVAKKAGNFFQRTFFVVYNFEVIPFFFFDNLIGVETIIRR